MNLSLRSLRPFLLAVPILLGGCQATMQRIADCKVGDWDVIGHKDGIAGEGQNFGERKDFCDDHGDDKTKAGADAPQHYLAGWTQGNWDFWSGRGVADGRRALLPSQYDTHVASAEVRKHNTPLNHPAYEAGWLIGNSEYWTGLGKREGTSGMPLTQKEINRSNAATAQMRYDDAAYVDGWQAGNRTFWQDAGFTDARNGTPDSAFKGRAAAATAAGVQVQEDAYRSAWNAELVNYWKNLGTQDAVSGKDFALRKNEAQLKGLKILETEYRQSWENRLADYWRQAGLDDGYGKPFQLDERIANAQRDGVFVISRTRELYSAAWDEQNARFCVPDNAFERGRHNAGMPVEVCRIELRNQLKRAYVSGQDYEVASAQYDRAQNDANDLSYKLHDAHRRLGQLEREIRANLDAKDRVINDETKNQDRRREQERRELVDHLQRTERQLDEARRWADRYQEQMQRLRRDIFLN